MSGPTLALGISAGGVDQVKLLADAVGLLDRNLASLQSRGGSTAGTASLGGLDQLLGEVQRIRQGVGEAAAGLRTEMADLKQTVTNSITDSMSAVGKAAKTAGKQASEAMESAAAETQRASEMYKAATKQVAAAINSADGDYMRYNPSSGLSGMLVQKAKANATAISSYEASMMVGSEKIAAAQTRAAEKLAAAQAQAATGEDSSMDAFIFRSNKSLAAFLKQRQGAAEAVEKSGVDAYTAKLMVGSEKIASAQTLAAQREEAANGNFVFRANKNLQAFLQQRQDEAAKVQRASQEIEAAYAASSKASQLRSQLGARAQLDQGIPTADVTAKFGSTATLAAHAKDAASLRKEIEHAAHSMDGFSLATSGAKRELLVIFGELVRGNYTRLVSSIDVLIRQSGATNYVFSLTALAFAASATAAIAAAVAYAKGTFELHAFEKQAILTGGAIGLSASQFTQARDSLEGLGVTKGKAAEALTAIAASGLLAGTNVKGIADAAIQLERAAGIPIEKTVKNFEDLARRPAEASAKLNETYHYLTATVYEQILALEKHGKTQEAAALAEQTYADTMTQRAKAIIDSQGYIEKGWHGIGNAAKRAWDAMLDLGREESLGDKLDKAVKAQEEAAKRLARARALAAGKTPGELAGGGGAFGALQGETSGQERDLASAQSNSSYLFRRLEHQNSNAASDAFNARSVESAAEFDRRTEQYASREQRMQREIDQVTASGKAGLKPQAQIDAAVAAIRANFERGNGGSSAGILGHADAASLQTQRYNELVGKGDFDTDPHLTAAETQLATIRQKLAVTTDGLKRAELERAASAAQSSIQVEREEKAARKHYEAAKAEHEQLFKVTEANERSADAIRQKTAQVEQENATYGKSKTAIEQANLALMSNQLAEADSSDRFDPKYVASLRDKTDAQREFVKQLQLSEVHHEQRKLDEDLRVAQEQTKTIEEENALLGLSQQQRDRILAQRKSELDLAKQIADIDKLNLGEGPEADTQRQTMKDKARETARLKAANEGNQKIYEQERKMADEVNKLLTDALLSGFEHGKNAAVQLRDSLKKMFSELVLRPIIQAVMAPVSGQLSQMSSSMLGGSGGGGTSFNGLGNLFSNGSGGFSNFGGTFSASNIGTMGQGVGGFLGFGGSGVATSSTFNAAMDSQLAYSSGAASATTGALGSMSSALPYVGSIYAASQGQYGSAAGMAIGTAIMPGIGTVIGAVIGSIVDSMSKKHGPKTESGYGVDDVHRGDGAAATQVAQTIQESYTGIASALGAQNTQLDNLGVFFATDPKGTAKTQLQVHGGDYTRSNYAGGIENVGRTDQEFKDAVSNATAQLIVKNLQASLGGKIGEYVRSLNVATITANSAEFVHLQAIATQRATIQQRLDALTAKASSAEDQLAKARAKELAATDELNRDLLQRVYAQEDLATASQNLVSAYSAQEQALNDSETGLKAQVSALQDYAKTLRTWVSDAFTGDASPLNAMEKLNRAAADFDSTLALAHGGDKDARGALTGKAGTYLSALKQNATSSIDYAMGFAKVTSGLTLEAAGADSQASVLQQQVNLQQAQLDAAKASLTQLGLINSSVMSFADAWAAYQTAKTTAAQLEAAALVSNSAPPATAATSASSSTPTSAPASEYMDGVYSVAGFASGGYHAGGLRLVGEHGPELEVTGASYIHDAAATRRILSNNEGASDDSGLIDALEGLRVEMRANVQFTYQLSKDIRELKQRGFPVKNPDDGTALTTV